MTGFEDQLNIEMLNLIIFLIYEILSFLFNLIEQENIINSSHKAL